MLLHTRRRFPAIDLVNHASILAKSGHFQFAVVLAHAGCDLYTETVLSQLLSNRPDPVLAACVLDLLDRKNLSLSDRRVRRVYGALTGDYPAGGKDGNPPPAIWWQRWQASRSLRHRIAHEGVQTGQREADDAVAIAHEYIAHLTSVMRGTRPP